MGHEQVGQARRICGVAKKWLNRENLLIRSKHRAMRVVDRVLVSGFDERREHDHPNRRFSNANPGTYDCQGDCTGSFHSNPT